MRERQHQLERDADADATDAYLRAAAAHRREVNASAPVADYEPPNPYAAGLKARQLKDAR